MIDIGDVVPVLSLSQEDERICLGDNMREMFKIIKDMEETVGIGRSRESPTKPVEISRLSKLIEYTVRILPFRMAWRNCKEQKAYYDEHEESHINTGRL